MNIKRVNILCFSPTQSTKRIAETVASAFGAPVTLYDATLQLGALDVPTFGPEELCIVGVPVYGGRIPQVAEAFYQSLRGQQTPAIALAVYGNRDFDDALLELTDYLAAGGFALLAAGAFVAEHSYGPEIAGGRPDSGDLALARALGDSAREKLEAAADASDLAVPAVTGGHPYKARKPLGGYAPDTSDACILCGVCAANCPLHIIDAEDPSRIDASRCIRCNSCVKKCPVGAKRFSHEDFLALKQMLVTNCAARREPALFL